LLPPGISGTLAVVVTQNGVNPKRTEGENEFQSKKKRRSRQTNVTLQKRVFKKVPSIVNQEIHTNYKERVAFYDIKEVIFENLLDLEVVLGKDWYFCFQGKKVALHYEITERFFKNSSHMARTNEKKATPAIRLEAMDRSSPIFVKGIPKRFNSAVCPYF